MSTYKVKAIIFRLDEEQRARAESDAKAAGCSVNELARRRFVGIAKPPARQRSGEIRIEREVDPVTGSPA